VHLNDVHNLTDAEELVGRTVYADVELEDDDELDFAGWVIVDRGRRIGVCTGLEDIPGNPCLEVQVEGSSESAGVLIPLHEDFIVEVDEGSRTLSLNLPDGLY
jgi:ribosomal 30S subunit maturation factor RimM